MIDGSKNGVEGINQPFIDISNSMDGMKQQQEEMQMFKNDVGKFTSWLRTKVFTPSPNLPPETPEVKTYQSAIAQQLVKEYSTLNFLSAATLIFFVLVIVASSSHPAFYINIIRQFSFIAGLVACALLVFLINKRKEFLKGKYQIK